MWASEDEEDGGRKGKEERKAASREVKEMEVLNRLQVTVICSGLVSSVDGSDGKLKARPSALPPSYTVPGVQTSSVSDTQKVRRDEDEVGLDPTPKQLNSTS